MVYRVLAMYLLQSVKLFSLVIKKQGSVFSSKAQNACRHVIDCPEA